MIEYTYCKCLERNYFQYSDDIFTCLCKILNKKMSMYTIHCVISEFSIHICKMFFFICVMEYKNLIYCSYYLFGIFSEFCRRDLNFLGFLQMQIKTKYELIVGTIVFEFLPYFQAFLLLLNFNFIPVFQWKNNIIFTKFKHTNLLHIPSILSQFESDNFIMLIMNTHLAFLRYFVVVSLKKEYILHGISLFTCGISCQLLIANKCKHYNNVRLRNQ